jgi:hypothetical protein
MKVTNQQSTATENILVIVDGEVSVPERTRIDMICFSDARHNVG